MNKLLIGAVSAIALTTLSACGGSGNAAADTAKASIKADILKNESTSTTSVFKMNDSQAGCTASSVVDSFGVSKLKSYGLLTADNKVTSKKFNDASLSTPDATTLVNDIVGCVGDATFTDLIKREVESRLPASVTATQKSCIEGKLTVDVVKQVIVAQLTHQSGSLSQLTTSIEACVLH